MQTAYDKKRQERLRAGRCPSCNSVLDYNHRTPRCPQLTCSWVWSQEGLGRAPKAEVPAEHPDTQPAAPLEEPIRQTCAELAEFLVEKNRAYGNSAADPIGVFAKRLDTLAQIDTRIDDKLNRLAKGSEYPGDDTVLDLAGYLILRMIVKKQAEEKVDDE
jgi:hypothetical protein